MKYLLTAALLALTFDIGLAFNGSAIRRHAVLHHQLKRQSSSTTSVNGGHAPGSLGDPSNYSRRQQFSSTSCKKPTITITVGRASTIWTTTTATASPTPAQSSTSSAITSHNSSHTNTIVSSSSVTSEHFQGSLSMPRSPWSLSSRSSPAQGSACPTGIQKKTDMPAYFGFNVINSKTYPIGSGSAGWKTVEDWTNAFKSLKSTFPNMNAVRMYSTTDAGGVEHLDNALQALGNSGVGLKVLVGVWSDDYDKYGRFDQELAALNKAITIHGCDNIFAVSVGNEDLERVKSSGASVQVQMVDKLVFEFDKVREVLRSHGCCVPVTHTDTYNEVRLTQNPWVSKLLSNVDQAIIANIFPYWENITEAKSWDSLENSAKLVATAANEFGKEVWLGETGWPFVDAGAHNKYGTSEHDAVDYFRVIGCQILSGRGTAFYYVDWDENNIFNKDQPSWGVLSSSGGLRSGGLSCDNFKPNTTVTIEAPKWLGGKM